LPVVTTALKVKMDRSTRYTLQKKQERISRHQLCERLDEFGWVPSSPAEDLGEDFLVHLYFQGQATGIIFHIQLKSITNLNERRRGDYLVYDDFEVKDLKHWEAFSQPVVLVVWDVKLREGRWALVDDTIKDLDERRPTWRTNKSKVRVYIPWQNTTDDAGLIRLKQSIGRYFYPLISQNKSLELRIELRFPDTEIGSTAFRAFERAIKEGEPVEVEGEYIQNLEFSEWWMRWFGEFDAKDMRIRLGPQESVKAIPAYIDFISSDGETFSAPTTELKPTGVGTEIIKLSNRHQNPPLIFYFTIPRDEHKKGEVSIRLNSENWGRNVSETREFVRFLQVATTGGKLILNSPPHGNILTIPVSPQPEKALGPQLFQLLDKLCNIQDKIGQIIQIPSAGLTDKDVQAIDEILAIIEYGKTISKTSEVTGEFKGQALEIMLEGHRQGKPIHLRISYPESFVELFDREIPTGRMTRHITGTPELSVSELEEAIKKLSPNKYLTIKFVDVEIVEVFPDWYKREAQRLSQCLINDFGVESVYLFGSLVWSDIHSIETDIDLAVKGLAPERYLEAVGYLERKSNFPIDLVELNKVPDHLRQRILAEGELLDEREPVMALG
jgi:predicted nucleotidyltransferase